MNRTVKFSHKSPSTVNKVTFLRRKNSLNWSPEKLYERDAFSVSSPILTSSETYSHGYSRQCIAVRVGLPIGLMAGV